MNALEKHAAKSKLIKALGRGLESTVRTVAPHQTPLSILAHEYGHAKTLMGAGKLQRGIRMKLYRSGGSYGGLGADARALKARIDYDKLPLSSRLSRGKLTPEVKSNMRKAGLDAAMIRAAGEAPKLVEEFLATYHGLKALKKFKKITPAGYKKARRDLIYAFGTYFSGAAGGVTGSALAARNAAKGGNIITYKGTKALGKMGVSLPGQMFTFGKLEKGMKDTPTIGRWGERMLRKQMGQDKIRNLQPKRGKRDPLGGFFLPPTKIPKEHKKEVDQYFGRGAWEAFKDGVISVPRGTKHEIRGGKKGLSDKLLDMARKMQQD